jgi:S1-C subfamily serine protease
MQGSIKTLWLVAALLAPVATAWAGAEFSYRSDNTLRWHSEGRYLHLATTKAGGVKVAGITPASLWGLSEGDVIVEADGHPVHDVAELLNTLRAHDTSPMPLKLRQAGVERTVALAAQAHELVPAPPPKPPVAPQPPAAPAAPAEAAHSRFVYQSDNSLRWRSDGQRLHLVTASEGGVTVVALTPASLWGLAQGDVIIAADGQPIHDVAALLSRLREHGASPIPLTVRRHGVEHAVALSVQAREGLLPTAPPPPPAPTAPGVSPGA